jgi:hypothetical protein
MKGCWESLQPLIEIARTIGWKGPIPPLQAEIKGRDVMLTIAITVAWLSVAMIYFMAATDRRTRSY